MRKIFTYCALLILFFSFTQAQNFRLEAETAHSVEFTHELNPFERNAVQINGNEYHNFGLTHKVVTSEKGEPALPFFSQAILISEKGKTSYEIQHDGYYEIDEIRITPSKGDLKRNVNPDTVPY